MRKVLTLLKDLLYLPITLPFNLVLLLLGNYSTLVILFPRLGEIMNNEIVLAILEFLSKNWLNISLLSIIIAMFINSYRIVSRYWWAEPNITLTTQVYDDYSEGRFYKNARLLVHNHEQIELTECFATLIYVADYYENDDREIPDRRVNGNRLKWSHSALSNAECKLSIPPTDKREVNVAHTKRNFEYLLCDRNIGANVFLATNLRLVHIRIDGKLDGKSFKPLQFTGYIFSQSVPYLIKGVEHIEEVKDGKSTIRNIPREIRNSVEFMIFGDGDWKKDEQIKGVKEYSRIETQKLKELYDQQQEENDRAVEKWKEENLKPAEMQKSEANKTPKKRKPSPKKISSKR
jgi:hypothetical protein